MDAAEQRNWLYDLAEEYASGVKDVNGVLPLRTHEASDNHLQAVIDAELAVYDANLVMTTPMAIYCIAVHREQRRRAKAKS